MAMNELSVIDKGFRRYLDHDQIGWLEWAAGIQLYICVVAGARTDSRNLLTEKVTR